MEKIVTEKVVWSSQFPRRGKMLHHQAHMGNTRASQEAEWVRENMSKGLFLW